MKFKKGDYVLYKVGNHKSICKIAKAYERNYDLSEVFILNNSFEDNVSNDQKLVFVAYDDVISMIDITSLLQMRCDLDRVINEIVSSREK